MVVVALLMLVLVWPNAGQAHEMTKPEVPTLTVTGTGHLAIAPDTAFVTFGMETVGKSLVEAQQRNTDVMRQVTERLLELHIPKEHIQTSSFTVSPHYKPPPKRSAGVPPGSPEIIGYTVSNTVTVEVSDPQQVAAVIETSLAAGANRFQGVHWALRDEQQAKLDALKQAAAKAREKAAALSGALKMKLLRLVSADEGGPGMRPSLRAARSMAAMDAGGEPPIFSGEMKVEAAVTLVYELAPE